MPWMTISYALLCIFLAAIVRGYSGFGFSLLAITSLSLMMPPSVIVPSIFMLEVAASLHLLPSIWKEVHWRSILPLIAGCLVATPAGVALLAHVPAPPMQLAMAAFVLAAAAMMLRGFAMKQVPGAAAAIGVGAASGLFNGAFGIGGPPVILFYFSSPASVAASRASVIAFFLATDLIGLAFQAREGLVTLSGAKLALMFLPALACGVWLGARSFKSADPAKFRRWVLLIIAGLAILTAGKAAWSTFG